MNLVRIMVALTCTVTPLVAGQTATEFCLDGHLDLGTRYQGTHPRSGEVVETTWCVTTEEGSDRVRFSSVGQTNPDMDGSWTVAYLPPDLVRIVNRDTPPDIEFRYAGTVEEAKRVGRLDPRRLAEELQRTRVQGVVGEVQDGRLHKVTMHADLPLRGRVEAVWRWDWSEPEAPRAELSIDGETLFAAVGRWRDLTDQESARVWQATEGAEAIQAPAGAWPARVNMRLLEVAEGVWLVRGVRTGFQHLVVDTEEGLIVADAPAGWVEFHHLPPADLVPGLGVSGLSERLVDFLGQGLPERPIHAVAMTHFHDDHSGGARAFAAAGATVYAPAESAEFLEAALNRQPVPSDRLGDAAIAVVSVEESMTVGSGVNAVTLVPIDGSPHTASSLGVLVASKNYFFVSDLHVPDSEEPTPNADRGSTECWFARWAAAHLDDAVRVANSHTAVETPVPRLRQYLGTDLCSRAAPAT